MLEEHPRYNRMCRVIDTPGLRETRLTAEALIEHFESLKDLAPQRSPLLTTRASAARPSRRHASCRQAVAASPWLAASLFSNTKCTEVGNRSQDAHYSRQPFPSTSCRTDHNEAAAMGLAKQAAPPSQVTLTFGLRGLQTG